MTQKSLDDENERKQAEARGERVPTLADGLTEIVEGKGNYSWGFIEAVRQAIAEGLDDQVLVERIINALVKIALNPETTNDERGSVCFELDVICHKEPYGVDFLSSDVFVKAMWDFAKNFNEHSAYYVYCLLCHLINRSEEFFTKSREDENRIIVVDALISASDPRVNSKALEMIPFFAGDQNSSDIVAKVVIDTIIRVNLPMAYILSAQGIVDLFNSEFECVWTFREEFFKIIWKKGLFGQMQKTLLNADRSTARIIDKSLELLLIALDIIPIEEVLADGVLETFLKTKDQFYIGIVYDDPIIPGGVSNIVIKMANLKNSVANGVLMRSLVYRRMSEAIPLCGWAIKSFFINSILSSYIIGNSELQQYLDENEYPKDAFANIECLQPEIAANLLPEMVFQFTKTSVPSWVLESEQRLTDYLYASDEPLCRVISEFIAACFP